MFEQRHDVWILLDGFAFWVIPVTFPYLLSFFCQPFYQNRPASGEGPSSLPVRHRGDTTQKSKSINQINVSIYRCEMDPLNGWKFIQIRKNASDWIQFSAFCWFWREACGACLRSPHQQQRHNTKIFSINSTEFFSLSKRFFQFYLWSGTKSDTKPREPNTNGKQKVHKQKELKGSEWNKLLALSPNRPHGRRLTVHDKCTQIKSN